MIRYVSTITDLLLGAAHADQRLEGRELETIRKLVAGLMGGQVPDAQQAQIEQFDPAKFDVASAAQRVALLSKDEKIKVLNLICTVHDSDGELDFAEDEYLRAAAKGMGVSAAEIPELTLEIIEETELPSVLS